MPKLTKNSRIAESLQRSGAIDIYKKHGMDCHACLGSADETIEQGALLHGINVDLLLRELNELEESGE